MAGKGSRPRPVDKNKFDSNYDSIFRKVNKCPDCGASEKDDFYTLFEKISKCQTCIDSVSISSDNSWISKKMEEFGKTGNYEEYIKFLQDKYAEFLRDGR